MLKIKDKSVCCALVKVDTKHVLYQINELSPEIELEEQNCLVSVPEFE